MTGFAGAIRTLLLETPFVPVVVALVFRPGFYLKGGPARWSSRVDLLLTVGLGVGLALVSTAWMTRYNFSIHSLTASDFSQYCNAVDAWRTNDMARWPGQRAVGAGFIAGLLGARLGIIDALVASTTLCMALIHGGLYLWGRALSSRLGGIAASLLGLSLAPLVALSRTVSFYPSLVAGFVLSAAGAALALRYRSLPALAAGGVGAGLVLLVDVRGLLWALPALGLTLVAALFPQPGAVEPRVRAALRQLPLRVLVVLLPLLASYGLGKWSFPEGQYTLEVQIVTYARDALRRASLNQRGPSSFDEVYARKDAFLWGTSSPLGIPQTLAFLAEANAAMPLTLADAPEARHARARFVDPWWWAAVGSMAIAVVGLRQRPALLLAYFGGLVPFLVAFRGASTVLFHPRYLANGMVALPVILGVAFALLAQGSLPRRDITGTPARSLATVGAASALALLIFGVLPSWLSPRAPFRLPVPADEEPSLSLAHVGTMPDPTSGLDVDCLVALGRDLAAGHPPGSRFWPETYTQAPGAPSDALDYRTPP